MFTSLWIDSSREIPESYDNTKWTSARSFHEAVLKLELIDFDEIDITFDLNSLYGDIELTGCDVIRWLKQRYHQGHKIPTKYRSHAEDRQSLLNSQIDTLRGQVSSSQPR